MRTLALLLLLLVHSAPALAASPRHGWTDVVARGTTVAVTNGSEIRVSRDGGEHFTVALAATGRVDALTIDDDGTVYVVRGERRLGAAPTEGKARWTTLAKVTGTEALIARGGVLLWRGGTKGSDEEVGYAISHDGGKTFAPRPQWPVGSFENVATLDARGQVHLIAAHEASCGGGYQEHVRGGVDAAELRPLRWDADQPFDLAVSEADTAYFLGECDDSPEEKLCAQSIEALAPVVLDAKVAADRLQGLLAATDGADTWLLSGAVLVRTRGAAGKVVGVAVPAKVTGLTVDGAHRPWLVADGAILRLDKGAWRRVDVRQ